MSTRGGQHLRCGSRSLEIAPHNQAAWAFTDGDDAFGDGRVSSTPAWAAARQVAWVEVVPLARRLNNKALRYLDRWASLAEETRLGGRARRLTRRAVAWAVKDSGP